MACERQPVWQPVWRRVRSAVARGDRRPSAAWARTLAWAAGGALLALAAPLAQAQSKPNANGIYTCTDAQGRKLTSDRPIPECLAREQRQLNNDGSTRRVVPPTLTADERAERDAEERRQAQARAAQADAVRRDRNLVMRFPNEAAHAKAREAALEPVRQAIKAGERRMANLTVERKRLDDEAEFYKGRTLPAALRQQLDANEGAVSAQRAAARNQESELARINALYDAELERLRRLWGGAELGTLPPVASTQPTKPPAKPAR